jgi:hypothetical protein
MEYLDNHFSIFVKPGATFATTEDAINQFKTDCVSDEISEIIEFNETLLAEGKMTETVSLIDGGVQIERTYIDEADVIRTWELDKNSKREINKTTRLAGWDVPFKI